MMRMNMNGNKQGSKYKGKRDVRGKTSRYKMCQVNRKKSCLNLILQTRLHTKAVRERGREKNTLILNVMMM